MIGRMESGYLEMQQELYSVRMVQRGRNMCKREMRGTQQDAENNEGTDVQVVQHEAGKLQQAGSGANR